MSTRLETLSPRPILRLLWAPRSLFVLLGAGSWTLGAAYLASVARFNASQLDHAVESAIFRTLMATMLLLALPALVAVVVGEAAQEVFRRPMTNRLPGLARRFSGGALSLGAFSVLAVALAFQLSWEPADLLLQEGNTTPPCPLATLSIAGLGYAAGSWLLARVGGGAAWVLRLGAFLLLAYFALPLLAAGTEHTLLALATLCLAIGLAAQRFRPRIVARMARGSVPTIFGNPKEWTQAGNGPHRAGRPGSELMPPEHFGNGFSAWVRAAGYLLRTACNWFKPWQGFIAVAAFPLVEVQVFALAGWLFGSRGDGESALDTVIQALFVGVGGGTVVQPSNSTMIAVGMLVGLLVMVTGPLVKFCFLPVSRRTRARLHFRSSVFVAFGFHLSFLGLVALTGLLYRSLGHEVWPGGLPLVGVVASVTLQLFPLLQILHLFLERPQAKGHMLWAQSLMIGVSMFTGVLLLKFLGETLATLALDSPGLAGLIFGLTLIVNFGLLRLVLGRHYRRADLVLS